MSQQFCPRLSEAIGSKILSLDKLFRTPGNCKFQNFAAGAFTHIYLIYEGKLQENFKYSTENWGFLYLKSLRMSFIDPNMDEGCRTVHRFKVYMTGKFLFFLTKEHQKLGGLPLTVF